MKAIKKLQKKYKLNYILVASESMLKISCKDNNYLGRKNLLT